MKAVNLNRVEKRNGRSTSISKKLFRLPTDRHCLRVQKTNLHFYVQVMSPEMRTVTSSSTLQLKLKGSNMNNAVLIAKDLTKKLSVLKIQKLFLHRGGFKYHGVVKLFVETMRENKFVI